MLDPTGSSQNVFSGLLKDLNHQLRTEIEEIAFNSDIDLPEYTTQVDDEVKCLEEKIVDQYISVGLDVATLHNQIVACDAILQRMESILANFHCDLGTISSEIQGLQFKSTLLGKRLQNRQVIRGQLGQFLSDMAVSESLIRHILFMPVTEQEFLENLHELDHKINFSREQSMVDYRSLEDVNVLLRKLKIKAVAKIREFLLQKIYAMRKPLTNYQIPQNQLLSYRFYNEFLLAHDRETAVEIRNEYVNTMSKVYYSYFKAYCAKLNKLQVDTTSERELLIGKKFEDQGLSTTSSVIGSMNFSSSNSLSSINAANCTAASSSTRLGLFGLGERAARVLGTAKLEAPIILPHVASKSEVKFPIEVLFRSIHFALLDAACREYFFLADFFLLSPGSGTSSSENGGTQSRAESGEALGNLFDQVLGRTFTVLYKQLENHILPSLSHDAVGMLICLQLLHAFLRLAHDRNVPVLDRFWTSIIESFWVRVTDRLDSHIASLQNDFDITGFSNDAKLIAVNPGVNLCGTTIPARVCSLLRPHPIARRYAELAASLHAIGHGYPGTPLFREAKTVAKTVATGSPTTETFDPPRNCTDNELIVSENVTGDNAKTHLQGVPPIDARILSRLAQLHTLVDHTLIRLSKLLPKQRLKWVFLINNYDLIRSVLTERGAGQTPEVYECREAVVKYISAFVEEALTPYFGSLMHFVRDFEDNRSSDNAGVAMASSAIQNDEARATRIIKGFNIDWKNSVEKIHGEIMVEFSNFTLGTEVFQALLAELVQQYHRFQKVMSQAPFKNLAVRNQMINIHHIMNDIKKWKTVF